MDAAEGGRRAILPEHLDVLGIGLEHADDAQRLVVLSLEFVVTSSERGSGWRALTSASMSAGDRVGRVATVPV